MLFHELPGLLKPALCVQTAGSSLADREEAAPNSKSYWIVKQMHRSTHELLCWASTCCASEGLHAQDSMNVLGSELLHQRGLLLLRWLSCHEHSRNKGVECLFEGIASIISSHDGVEPDTSAHGAPSVLQA